MAYRNEMIDQPTRCFMCSAPIPDGMEVCSDICAEEMLALGEFEDVEPNTPEPGYDEPMEPSDNMTDVEADADTLRSAGWGTDEDYGLMDDDSGGW